MVDLHPRFFGSFPALISQNKLKNPGCKSDIQGFLGLVLAINGENKLDNLDVNQTSKVFQLILADNRRETQLTRPSPTVLGSF